MKPERRRQIERIYQSALECEDSRRDAFLSEACAGDESLRREVESLLASQPNAGCLVESPTLDEAANTPAKESDGSTAGKEDGASQGRSLFSKGQKLSGRYLIQEAIGGGSFGEVYRAYDELLGRVIALKALLLHRAPSDSSAASDQFLQEARTIAKLDHPNIVPVYDAGIEGSIPWIVLRLVGGQSLALLLRKEGKLQPDRALELLIQASQALEHAHHKGIIHRDVKPSNILIEPRDGGGEHLWLTDFGIARLLSGDITATGEHIVGTPRYMSPEQITGKRVDARTDIFALGCVAYEVIVGACCFEGETFSQVMYNIVHQQPERMSEVRRIGGARLEAIVKRALAKSAEDRFQTAAEMAEALETALAGDTVRGGLRLPLTISRVLRQAEAVQWDGEHTVSTEGVAKAYRPGKNVLNGVTFNVKTGSIYALLGRNGSGKTTLIQILLGAYKPDAGRVSIFGRDPGPNAPAILTRLGYVPEVPVVYPWLKVSELLQLLSKFFPQWDQTYCYHLLEKLELPLEVRLRDLSKGMQTKVSLLTALAHRPEFLLLDDPTVGLDAVVINEFFETIREASRREGTTVLISSHNLDEVQHVATHIGFLKDGKIFLSGSLQDLQTRTRQVNLVFRDDPPDLGHLANFRQLSSSGRRLTGVVLDASSGVLEKLKSFGPEQMEVQQLSLKEIFVSFLR